ncbi:hypothetical protein ACFUMH_03810 [Cellulomonas sp. NPDC057328]|uniref:hypothetical protein n=1 Tax=Cellulomonas sp. NPDC057328 TaxID=3346101 RepID=UPI003626A188
MVDDDARPADTEVLPREKGATCARLATRAAARFTDHGISRVERTMTDNMWAHRQVFATDDRGAAVLAPGSSAGTLGAAAAPSSARTDQPPVRT